MRVRLRVCMCVCLCVDFLLARIAFFFKNISFWYKPGTSIQTTNTNNGSSAKGPTVDNGSSAKGPTVDNGSSVKGTAAAITSIAIDPLWTSNVQSRAHAYTHTPFPPLL